MTAATEQPENAGASFLPVLSRSATTATKTLRSSRRSLAAKKTHSLVSSQNHASSSKLSRKQSKPPHTAASYSRNATEKNYKAQKLLTEICSLYQNKDHSNRTVSTLNILEQIHSYYKLRSQDTFQVELKRRMLVEIVECFFYILMKDFKTAWLLLKEYKRQCEEDGILNHNGMLSQSVSFSNPMHSIHTCTSRNFSIPKEHFEWILEQLIQVQTFCLTEECSHLRNSGKWELLYVKLSQMKRLFLQWKHNGNKSQHTNSSTNHSATHQKFKLSNKDLAAVESEMKAVKRKIRQQISQLTVSSTTIERDSFGSDSSKAEVPDDTTVSQNLTSSMNSSRNPGGELVLVEKTPQRPPSQKKIPFSRRYSSQKRLSDSPYVDMTGEDSPRRTPRLRRSSFATTNGKSSRSKSRSNSSSRLRSPRKNKRPGFFKSYQLLSQMVPNPSNNTSHSNTQSLSSSTSALLPRSGTDTPLINSLKSPRNGSQSARVASASASFSSMRPKSHHSDRHGRTAVRRHSVHAIMKNNSSVKGDRPFVEVRNSSPRSSSFSSASISSSTTTIQKRELTQSSYIADRVEYIHTSLVKEKQDYEEALKCVKNILLTLQLGEISKDPATFARLYALTAHIHWKLDSSSLSLVFQKQAIKVCNEYMFHDLFCLHTAQLARMMMHLGDYKSAAQQWMRAASMTPVSESQQLVEAYQQIAYCYSQMGKHKESARYLEEVLHKIQEADDVMSPSEQCNFLLKIGKEHDALGQHSIAGRFLEEALDMAQESGEVHLEASVLEQLKQCYEKIRVATESKNTSGSLTGSKKMMKKKSSAVSSGRI